MKFDIMMGFGLALIIAFALFAGCEAVSQCHAKGGHMVSLYKTSVCVSTDGRILE